MSTPALGDSACAICGNAAGNVPYSAREMMFGARERFAYFECAACGCLQIAQVPADLGRWYGPSYYSVAAQAPRRRPIFDRLKALRTRAYLGHGGGALGRLLLQRFGPPGLPDWATKAGMRQDSSILEVGCGTGSLLLTLRSEGFSRLTGADPFIEQPIDHGEGLKILKSTVAEIDGQFDFIVLEHAFEHIPDPQATLRGLAARLAPRGMLIISLPIASFAWQHYGVDWVQLDAPRHLFLHTERSFRLLARDMDVVDVVYDSGAVQFWGSEQYRRDLPLLDPKSHRVNPAASMFSAAEIEAFSRRAEELNRNGQGDQATFYLRG